MASSRTSRSSSTTRTVFAGFTMFSRCSIWKRPRKLIAPPRPARNRGAAGRQLARMAEFRGGRMHAWDAGQYLRFADERTRPALDLVARIDLAARRRIVD